MSTTTGFCRDKLDVSWQSRLDPRARVCHGHQLNMIHCWTTCHLAMGSGDWPASCCRSSAFSLESLRLHSSLVTARGHAKKGVDPLTAPKLASLHGSPHLWPTSQLLPDPTVVANPRMKKFGEWSCDKFLFTDYDACVLSCSFNCLYFYLSLRFVRISTDLIYRSICLSIYRIYPSLSWLVEATEFSTLNIFCTSLSQSQDLSHLPCSMDQLPVELWRCPTTSIPRF